MPRAVVDTAGTVHLMYVREGTEPRQPLPCGPLSPARSGLVGAATGQQPGAVSVSGLGPVDGAQLALGLGQPAPRRLAPGRARRTSSTPGAAGTASGFEPPARSPDPRRGQHRSGSGRRGWSPTATVFVFWHAGAVEDARRERIPDGVSRRRGDLRPGAPGQPAKRKERVRLLRALAAMTEPGGAVHVSYRGAGDNVRRGQRLLTSTDARSHLLRPAGSFVGRWGPARYRPATLFAGPNVE